MGDRYFITVICPECNTEDNDVYYAPTCNFVIHKCSGCGIQIDLEKYTGITHEDASNLQEIKQAVATMQRG
jgi:hypothetical protein